LSYSKGDLVLTVDQARVYTCILLTNMYTTGTGTKFYYSHCVETGSNGILYEGEIDSLISKEFAPNFEYKSDIFDQHYWYEMMLDRFAQWPVFWPYDYDDDESDED